MTPKKRARRLSKSWNASSAGSAHASPSVIHRADGLISVMPQRASPHAEIILQVRMIVAGHAAPPMGP